VTQLRSNSLLWLFAVVSALASLTAYVVIKGYHHESDLMIIVLLVRLVSGLGIGVTLAIVFSIVQKIRRRTGIFATFVNTTAILSSITIIGLVLLNLIRDS